ncbi:MAG: NosD domain-containing protein, partial [Candidatus Saccharimonadales bacterium]
QVQINQALTAATGKKVVLLAGTYTIDASISIPNNTTLSGIGQGTLITIPNALNVDFSAIVNTDTTTGTNITLRDLKLDGNKANQSGAVSMAGVDFNNMGGGSGATARQGARITNVQANNWYGIGGFNCQTGSGICLFLSSNNTLTGNTVQGNSNGISLSSSSNNTLTGNTVQGNSYGIHLFSSSNNTLTGNTVQGNSVYGISLSSSSNNTLTGNTAQGNSVYGISLSSSSNNTIGSNKLHDNGGATNNSGIYLNASDSNTITGNDLTDTSCTTTCYAIDITASATKNYLEANRFSGSPANAASINDLGTGTIYAGQQKNSTTSINSDVSDFLFRGSANSTTAFNIQNASGVSVMNIDTTNGELELGNYNGGTSPVAGKIVLATTANANTVTLASAAQTGSYTLSIPALTANADICTSLNNCSNLTSTSGIQNQNTIQQSTSNFWISGTGRADTSVLTPTLDTATATILNIGTTTATSLLLGRTTTTTTVQGSLTVGASAGTGTFMNNGATINTEKTYGNFAAGGAIDTAANSVDKYTYFSVAQTTTGQTITLPTPTTNPTSVFGRIIHVSNIGSASFTIGGSLILPGYTATFVWSNTDGAAAGGETWQYAGDGGGSGSYIQNQTATTQTGGFNINGAGTLGGLLTANAGLTVTGGAINLNTASNFAVNIASTSNTVAVNIGNSANVTNIGSNATYLGTSGGAIVLTAAAQSGAAAGNNLTIKAGAGGTGNQNGGTLTLSGGDKSGTGVLGLVSLNPTAFASSATQVYGTTGVNTLAAGFVDNYSTIPATASVTGVTMVIPDPALNTTVGRILYVSATSASQDFTLRLNSTRAKIDINLKANSTATLIWNGTDWTAAGASSATDLQAAYNNTQTAAGGAEIVLNSANAGAGLTIRNSGTPITGALFEVQSSIAANLFSVNNSTTEYALNGGAESATFTGNWAAIGAATVSQNTTLSNVASGLASVNASISGAGQGAKDTLSTSLPAGVYVVSFAAKVAAGTNTFNAWYSNNGTAQTATCDSSLTGTGYTITQNFPVTTSWTKVSCFITVPAGATSSNAILIANTANASFYIDNLSVISNAAGTTPANVQIGGGTTGGQPTLFTLDQFAGPPMTTDTAAYYGSMYYDTTKNAIQCYQKADTSGVWGACGSAPDDIISMTPEYTGAVLNGSGVGTMTADFCGNIGSSTLQVNTNLCSTVGEARNFYRWTSPQATAQTYGIYVTYRLPSTFKSFKAGTMSLTGLIDSTSNAGVTYSVFRKAVGGGITQCSADTTNISSANTWTAKGPATDITASSCAAGGASAFVAGDTLIIRINVSAQSNANAYVENLTFQYSNK